MTISQVWAALANDAMLKAMVVLIAVDIVLGVTAAVKSGQFSFAKVAAFARDDLLGKVVPWGVLYGAWKFAPAVDVLGVGFEEISRAAGAIVIAALVGSLTSSLADLGIKIPIPQLNRGEKA